MFECYPYGFYTGDNSRNNGFVAIFPKFVSFSVLFKGNSFSAHYTNSNKGDKFNKRSPNPKKIVSIACTNGARYNYNKKWEWLD